VSAPALLAIARVSAREAFVARSALVGRVLFFGVLLLVFSRLWQVVPLGDADPRAPIWYLALTEWVLLSIPHVHLEVERDFATGDVAYLLPQPVPYPAVKVAGAYGEYLARLATLGLFAFPATFLLAGGLPADARALPLALPIVLVSGLLGILVQTTLGVASVWVTEVQPLYWVWQKGCFVLGGLILPLDVYPSWLSGFARATPFAAILYAPGRTALGLDAGAIATSAALLVGWTVVAFVALRLVVARGLRVLDVNGG
jgi:ABC-2 type transport system permease protein